MDRIDIFDDRRGVRRRILRGATIGNGERLLYQSMAISRRTLLKAFVAYVRRHGDPAAFARVRHASSGGDMVPPELLEA